MMAFYHFFEFCFSRTWNLLVYSDNHQDVVATNNLMLFPGAPLRPQEGGGPEYNLRLELVFLFLNCFATSNAMT